MALYAFEGGPRPFVGENGQLLPDWKGE